MNFREFEKQAEMKENAAQEFAQEEQEVYEEQEGQEVYKSIDFSPELGKIALNRFKSAIEKNLEILVAANENATIGDLIKELEKNKAAAEAEKMTELKNAAQQYASAYLKFYDSEQWKNFKKAFPDVTDEIEGTIFFHFLPDLFLEVSKRLPEIIKIIKDTEKEIGQHISGKDLLLKVEELPEIYRTTGMSPENMLLYEFLMKAAAADTEKIFQEQLQESSELSKKHISPNTALSNAIRGGLVGLPARDIPVNNNKGITIYGQAWFDFSSDEEIRIRNPEEEITGDTAYMITADAKGKKLKILGKHTAFDDAVREAIYSKIAAAKNSGKNYRRVALTSSNIFQEMNHTKRAPSAAQKGAITKSIEKQRRLMCDIDLTEDFKMRGKVFIDPDTKEELPFAVNDHFLKMRRYDLGKGSNRYSIYQFTEYPLELNYAETIGQIITYKAELLDIKDIDSNGKLKETGPSITEPRILMRNYLLRRSTKLKYVEKKAQTDYAKYQERRRKKMENGEIALPEKKLRDFLPVAYKDNFRINFDTLFEETGLTEDIKNRNTAQRYRDYCFLVLDNLKARGEIKSYKPQKKGRGGGIFAVDIFFE